jgi:hypothetical protein
MDPKSFAGKPPVLDALTPEFGAKLSEWVMRDMLRAKKAKEEQKKRKEAAPSDRQPKADKG